MTKQSKTIQISFSFCAVHHAFVFNYSTVQYIDLHSRYVSIKNMPISPPIITNHHYKTNIFGNNTSDFVIQTTVLWQDILQLNNEFTVVNDSNNKH